MLIVYQEGKGFYTLHQAIEDFITMATFVLLLYNTSSWRLCFEI